MSSSVNSQPDQDAKGFLEQLMPKLNMIFRHEIIKDQTGWNEFVERLRENFAELFASYSDIYRDSPNFLQHVEDLLANMARAWFARTDELRQLDRIREQDPKWFQSNQMLGGVCYVDLFAENLKGIKAKIPYFKELGLTYLHLMPLFDSPKTENDGGYAVSNYRAINPALGTMDQLRSLAHHLRQAGISLAVDFVLNHTSDEHIWARRAIAGEAEFEAYYRIFPDRSLPDAYEKDLREIFPEEHPGAFTFNPEMNKWVWTTFHSYQWDLNYENPVVFNQMADEMLFLANQGVEIFRFDAIAFIWKEMGSNCENLPKAHTVIRAFNAVTQIAAPSLLFKSEAIVHPDDVVKYISADECKLSYNPLLMALLWNSLATRKVKLLSKALEERFQIDPKTAWVNYVRVHDDIGWTFSDEDASALGVNANDHRRFLNEFYRGRFPGSFARGLPFQENLKTGDCRISGTCASLAGLEKALTEDNHWEVELSIRRILLVHGLIMTLGGIPLIYLGDEIGTLNDYGYRDNPAHQNDSRWVHRRRAEWERYNQRNDPTSIEGRIYQGFLDLVKLRKGNEEFSVGRMDVIRTENEHVLGFTRSNTVVMANFSEAPQSIRFYALEKYVNDDHMRLLGTSEFVNKKDLMIDPLDFLVIDRQVRHEA